jgi:hypothetical protein
MKEGKMKRTGAIIAVLGFFLAVPGVQAQWGLAQRLTWNSGSSQFPVIAVDSSGQVHVAWQDETPGNFEIYYKKSPDGGTSWAANTRLSWTSTFSHMPAIKIDAIDDLHVLWDDDAPGNTEIYQKKHGREAVDSKRKAHLDWISIVRTSRRPLLLPPYGLSDLTPGNRKYHKKEHGLGLRGRRAIGSPGMQEPR